MAKLMSEAAVSPVAICVGSIPPPARSRYCNAAPTAFPPGTTRLIAFPASCDVPIRKYRCERRHRPIRAQMHTKLAASSPAITTNHTGFTWASSPTDPKTATSEGHTT